MPLGPLVGPEVGIVLCYVINERKFYCIFTTNVFVVSLRDTKSQKKEE